jgi:outer membrane immunogenic protein
MEKFLLGSVALAALFAVSSAQAADLAPPVKAPAPPVVTWSGCYIGGNVGAAWGTDKVSPLTNDHVAGGPNIGSVFPRTSTIDLKDDVFGGGTVGCNYEALGFAVFGIEGDGGWLGLRGSVSDPPHETHTVVSGGYGDITGRLGVAVGPVLFYGKGGGVARETRPL